MGAKTVLEQDRQRPRLRLASCFKKKKLMINKISMFPGKDARRAITAIAHHIIRYAAFYAERL